MPKNAEALLKVTQPKGPKNMKQNSLDNANSDSDELSDYDEDDKNSAMIVQPSKTSTPLDEKDVPLQNLDFKQRLEKILASPISKPERREVKVVMHQSGTPKFQQPIPMPRKRVMFNQPEVNTNRIDSGSSEDDNDRQK